MAARTIEVIVLGKDQASGILGKIGGSLSGLGSVAAGVATGGLALAATAVVGLGAAAAGAVAGITKLTFAAAEVEGTRRTFETLNKDLGGSKMAMEALEKATRGMVNEADLMAASNKFLTMGLTETIEETAEMTEMATQLGMAMGTDATKSMEDFALMMANQSIPRLDTFGISSAKVRERIIELMDATEGLSREEAFKIAVMEQGRIAMKRVGEQGESATATTLRWRAAIDDLKLQIGQAFIPALEAIRKPVLELVERYGPRLVEWANIAGRWLGENIPRAIAILEAIWNKVFPEAGRIVTGFWDTIRPALLWVQDIVQRFYTTYLPYLRDAWNIVREGWSQIIEIYRTQLKPALAELWNALNIGQGASFDLAGAIGHVQGFLVKLYASGVIEMIKVAIQGLVVVVKALVAAYEIGVHWGIRIRDVLNSMIGVFNNIRHWISIVVEKFNHFKSTLGGFELPWWLRPGSPTPLETGLAGIEKALARVQGLAGGGLTFGGMTLAGAGAGAVAGGGVTTISITNNFGPGSIRSDQDILAVADATAKSLELRGIGPIL